MKSPDSASQTQLKTDGPEHVAAVLPWGMVLGRVVVEHAIKAGISVVRAKLKARVEQDHPEGKAMARREYFAMQRGLPDEARRAASPAARVQTKVAKSAAHAVSGPGFAAKAKAALPLWRDLGPTLIPHGQTYGSGPGATPSVAGRCSGVMVDRSNPQHLVACSAGGGLWGSSDTGATWAPLTDRQPTLVMGAIAQAPSAPGIVYAATGDGDGQVPYGIGLLRSSDGGASWSAVPVPSLKGLGSYDLAVDPTNALRVWIATDRALHFSSDGGQTVKSIIAAPCWSVSINPTAASEVMAAFANGLARSADGGATWTHVVLPGTDGSTQFSRLEVCHAPGQPAVAYVAGCVKKQAMLWRRASIGGAFTALNVPSGMKTSQAWYDWCLAVAPDDADLVFWGAIDLYRGKRGVVGMSWTDVSSRNSGDSIHPDQHFVSFDSNQPGVVYASNDGGVFRSADRGEHWTSLNPGLGITEFEFLAQLESQPSWMLGGTQDNGSLALAGPRHWDQVALGDGGDCAAVDRGAASICFHSYYDMPIERAAALGAAAFSWTDVTPPVPDGYAALFYPPLEASGDMLTKAGASLWVSADSGASWDEALFPTSGDADPDLATAMAIIGDHTVIVGMLSGQLYRVARGGGAWSAATVTALARLPNGFVSDIGVVGATGKTVWASCSQIGAGHVFRSTDSGKTFTDRSGALPDMAVNAFVVDPKHSSRLYLATDRGVWRSTNSGTNWSEFNNGLPNVIVGDLMLHAGTRVLRAGTRSRGAWEVKV